MGGFDECRLALASLSGESDAAWARAGAEYADCAFLGGIALDEATRSAAREMVDRDRSEFLPADPLAFLAEELDALADAPIRPGINVRSSTLSPITAAGRLCARHDAILEINAHCRQDEMCAAGAGEALLGAPESLTAQDETAAATGADVSVKVRAGLPGVDLPAVADSLEAAGAAAIHVDAMDSEPVVADLARATDCFLIANNGVRDRETTREYLVYGADAVSVGRPSDDPAVLAAVRAAVDAFYAEATP